MIRLSELLGRPVSAGGERLGRVSDLALEPEHCRPAVIALIAVCVGALGIASVA